MLTTADIQRWLYWDKESKTHNCFCFVEVADVVFVLSAASNKHRALATKEAMGKAVYRFGCGPMQPCEGEELV
jgi:hypothetical protein